MLKKIIIGIVGFLIFLGGIALVFYPFISNYIMDLNHASEITEQEAVTDKSDDEAIREAFKEAKIYNKSLLKTIALADPFDPLYQFETDLEYEKLLNFNNDSIMGSVEIPKIGVKIPIFHGTSPDVLKRGVGHLSNSSLPIGGKSTHAILTGHTGASNSSFFTDLDKLDVGDVFFLRVLNRTLSYEIDQVKVVLPSHTRDLLIKENKDYVTLITCTPYGVNSHRLLVRGKRVHYSEEEIEDIKADIKPLESRWMAEYKRALVIGAIVLSAIIVIFIALRIYLSVRKKKKAENTAGS